MQDEPTNHLDMETIDSLARAINNWDGGMALVSHDFRLISQVHSWLSSQCTQLFSKDYRYCKGKETCQNQFRSGTYMAQIALTLRVSHAFRPTDQILSSHS